MTCSSRSTSARRPRRDEPAEVEHGGGVAASPTRGSCRGRPGSTSAPVSLGDAADDARRVAASPRPEGPRRARRAARARGVPTTARATSTRRRCARAERADASSARSSSRPTNSIASFTSWRRRRTRSASCARGPGSTFSYTGQVRDRLLGLERAPHSPARPPEVGHREQVVAERAHDAFDRPDEPAEHVEERRLAGAVRPDEPARARRRT